MNDLSNMPGDEDLYAQVVGDMAHRQRAMVDEGLAANPDDAAEALGLSNITGEPAPAIAANFDDYKDNLRRQTAMQLVLNNPELITYLQAHPMAASVSNDDWGNLDKFSADAKQSSGLMRALTDTFATPVKVIDAALRAFGENSQTDIPGALVDAEKAADTLFPSPHGGGVTAHAMVAGASAAGEILLQTMSTIASGAAAGAGAAGQTYLQSLQDGTGGQFGQGIGSPAQFGREASSLVEWQMQRGDLPLAPHGGEAPGGVTGAGRAPPLGEIAKHDAFIAAAQKAQPWIENGIEPPAGLDPLIDQSKAALNAKVLEGLERSLENAQAALTNTDRGEAGKQLFASFVKQRYGDSTFDIRADAALNLYGDKPPTHDDGLLGWVPGIETQLAGARDIGTPITVKVSDYLARVDPAVHKEIRDDLLMYPGGITANEAKVPIPPHEVVDAPIAQVRDASGLEPKFSMGDRKLTLSDKIDLPAMLGVPASHAYDLLDEHGKRVGDLGIVPGPDGKTLYVNYIGGDAGLWANSFGPALMRDLFRQLKVLYPDYERVTGHRVSGARDKWGFGGDLASVKLDIAPGDDLALNHQRASEIFQNGWEQFSQRTAVNRQDQSFFTPEQQAFGQAAHDEIQRITGGGLDVQATAGIRAVTGEGETRARGMYAAFKDQPPTILLDLLGDNPIGVGRHEAVHFLRDNNFLTTEEWAGLSKAAQTEDWLGRHNVDKRYPGLDGESKIEEAVAESYREWAAQAPEIRPKTGVGAIFQKMTDLFDRIKARLGFGPEVTWETIFQKIHSGEVGERGPGTPRREGAFDLREKFSIEGDDNLRAQAVGLPLESFRQLQDAYRKQHEADLKAAQSRAEKDQARRQTKEWRANRADMAAEVSKEINQRPDIMADAFIGSGELNGQKLQQRFTLRAEDLTPEQQAVMPAHYVSTHGLPADQVAGMFGYSTKAELVDALAKVNAMRQAATGDRLTKGDFMRRMVQAETDRRMELRYGHLDENIMDAAQDQALSDASMNVMHEELTAQAMKAGVTVFDKEVMQSAAKSLINEKSIGQVSSYKLMQLIGKHARDAQKALLDGDAAGAAVAMQKQTVTAYVAKEARAVEKEVTQFDKLAKRMSKREIPSMEPEYTNWVHQILSQVGKKIQRSPEDLAREIEASGTSDLQTFVNDKTSFGQIMEVWDRLYDKDWSKAYKDLQVLEFRGVRDSVKTIIHNGREERKLINAGNEADADALKKQLAAGLQQFPETPLTMEGEKNPPGLLRHTWARLLTAQTVLNRWDGFDWKGPWQQAFYRPLSEGANQLAVWEKEMARTFRDIVNRPSDSENVVNTVFRNPINGQLSSMTRENLRAVMLYMGSETGFDKLVRGYSLPKFKYTLTRDGVKAWVDSVATKEDWDFVEGIWKAMEVPRGHSSTMYRSMSDLPLQGIEPVPIDTPFGRKSGGYVPIRFSRFYEGKSGKLSGISLEGLFGSGYSTGFAPSATYKIERTGYAAPLDLTLDSLVPATKQQLRDAALRPALANASKILRDPDIAAAIKSRYGSEYHDMLKEYLRRLAGTENQGGPQGQYNALSSRVLNMARQNLIGTLVGLNPGTVMKHGGTAFFLSAFEVGPINMMRAMKQLYTINDETGLSWRRFAYENSQELQRRDRNWRENLYGSTDEAKGAFEIARQQMLTWGSKPVTMADALSSEPTWLAAYNKARDDGGSHGDGIFAGDRAVQRAHGSTSDAAKPMIMSHLTPWVTSLYNFFNDILNRAVETMWRAGELAKQVKSGEWAGAPKLAVGVAAGMFVTSIWPAIMENLVSPMESEPGDSTTKRALKGSVHSVAAMFPIIRDFASYVMGGSSPDVGLLTTEYKVLGEAMKDLQKKAPFNGPHAEKLIKDFGTMIGALTGAPGMQIGRVAGFGYGLNVGIEHPRGPWGWAVGGRFGTIKGHSPTFEDYLAGRSLPAR